MADAAVGGKTGFDLLGIKNLAGTFYPAAHVYMPLESLKTLPDREWMSGMAELIKTALLDTGDMPETLKGNPAQVFEDPAGIPGNLTAGSRERASLFALLCRSVAIKGRIVEADPRETGRERILLNLGHSFAHALESSAGLGRLSHGEAVAWGIVRACELGLALDITPPARAREIRERIRACGYETGAPHPLMGDGAVFMRALWGDKKKKAGKLIYIVPAAEGAVPVSEDRIPPGLLQKIVRGENFL
jgi:3-dehydroquinate synthase